MGKQKKVLLLLIAIGAWVISAKAIGRLIAIQLVGENENKEKYYFFTSHHSVVVW
jgi:hypothetical protein